MMTENYYTAPKEKNLILYLNITTLKIREILASVDNGKLK